MRVRHNSHISSCLIFMLWTFMCVHSCVHVCVLAFACVCVCADRKFQKVKCRLIFLRYVYNLISFSFSYIKHTNETNDGRFIFKIFQHYDTTKTKTFKQQGVRFIRTIFVLAICFVFILKLAIQSNLDYLKS